MGLRQGSRVCLVGGSTAHSMGKYAYIGLIQPTNSDSERAFPRSATFALTILKSSEASSKMLPECRSLITVGDLKPARQTLKPARQTLKPARQTLKPARQTLNPARRHSRCARLLLLLLLCLHHTSVSSSYASSHVFVFLLCLNTPLDC